MRLVCPGCGLTCSAEGWVNDAAIREMLVAMSTLAQPLPPAVLHYLSLFRPTSSAMSWSKALKLVREIAALTGTGNVQVQGQVSRPCPAPTWALAMDQMVAQRDTLKRPMKNHNYLRQVAWSMADAEDLQVEKSRDVERQTPFRRPVDDPTEARSSDAVARENLRKIQAMLRGEVVDETDQG
ncbi:MAG: hypothetical protein OEY01_10825 [Desulfobulbaceae bacterium]|nr:hypothetical protein [Desulfobulbaceae bacterium]